MWFINTILGYSRELILSPSVPCILETVVGKKNSKVISDERQTWQQDLNILGFLFWEKGGGETFWHANHSVVQQHSRNTRPSRTRHQRGIYLISFPISNDLKYFYFEMGTFRMWNAIPIWHFLQTCAGTSSGDVYGHCSMFSMYRENCYYFFVVWRHE